MRRCGPRPKSQFPAHNAEVDVSLAFCPQAVLVYNDDIRRRVDLEYESLRRLKHSHIVAYVDVATFRKPDGILVRLYMEYCEQGDLHVHIQSQLQRRTQTRELAFQNENFSPDEPLLRLQKNQPARVPLQRGVEQKETFLWHNLAQLTLALAYCHYGVRGGSYQRNRNRQRQARHIAWRPNPKQ